MRRGRPGRRGEGLSARAARSRRHRRDILGPRQVGPGVCGVRAARRGHARRASRGAFQSRGEKNKRKKLYTPRGGARGEPARAAGTGRGGGLGLPSDLRGRGSQKRVILSHKGSRVGAAGGARGAVPDPAAAGQEDAALGPARPGAQRGEERTPQRRARCPGPWPRRPPRLGGKHGRRGAGGSRFAPAGGRAPRSGPGGGVAVSAEGNGARGAKVLER